MLIWAHMCMLIIKKNILIPSKGHAQGLDNTALSLEAEDSNTFTEEGKKFCLSSYDKRSNSYLFDNGVNIYQFKAKYELFDYHVFLGNILKQFLFSDLLKNILLLSFNESVASSVNGSGSVNPCNHTKCLSLNNQQSWLNVLLWIYYPFAVKIYRCVGSCNTLYDLSDKLCVSDKTEDKALLTWSQE